jgi:hypothetical protein
VSEVEDLRLAHRRLDLLLGRFLAAADAGGLSPARDAIAAFDDELRRHTELEEDTILPPAAGRGLAPAEDETDEARLGRLLRLEHVQIREVSGLMRRLVEEKGDVAGARRLFPNLARRWEAHTEKEERQLLPPR